ncbi:MAG: hypothetical protein OEQ39_02900 [Gammaproteobacteria bacterium]|nr:hypothetical protein [Gammaproteobacteria bacterium]MDH3375898.1 hypothetical protein [Gammaproteobacteria bacterium]
MSNHYLHCCWRISAIILADVAAILILLSVTTGCVTVTFNIAIGGRIDRPSTQTDTPYRSNLPWIDAGGDASQENEADQRGPNADMTVPLTP